MIKDWVETQRLVLAYIFFKGREDAFTKAAARLQAEYFNEKRKALWDIFCAYHKQTMGLPDIDMLRKFLRSRAVSEELIYSVERELYDVEEQANKIDIHGFLWSVGRIEELFKQLKFQEHAQKSAEVMKKEGFARGRDEMLVSLARLDGTSADITPEGLLSDEIDVFIEEVSAGRDARATLSVDLGIESLDKAILGLRGGEVVLIVGWQGVGKTTMLVNSAIHIACVQKKNVVFVTTETIKPQVRRRLFARMTKLPIFDVPISSQKFKAGTLSEVERNTFLKLKNYVNSGQMGHLMVVQAPANATMEWLRTKLLQYEAQFKVDILLLDDIRNMVPRSVRKQEYEEVGQLLRDFKKIARTHANRGIPVVSPYHINRETYKYLNEKDGGGNKKITMAGLASSSEAERITDVGVFIWENESSPNQLELDVVKMRDGASIPTIRLAIERDYQYIDEIKFSAGTELDNAID